MYKIDNQRRKTALITGASGEIGSEVSLMLAKNNFDLILHFFSNYEKIKTLQEGCKEYGVNVVIKQADLSKYDDICNIFKFINDINMNPNVVINSAGISNYGLIQDVSYSDWKGLIDLHLMGTYFCTQKALPEMLKQNYGRIINISSIWGENGAANEVLYSMSKGAINSFTKALAKELAPSGITVNAIAPGIVMSKMMSHFTLEEIEELKTEIPMNRFAKPIEIAESVLHLLHHNSAYITGQIINIDGGWN
ncbi:MAG: SDR family oxidoreductase [Vulcanibacillus sp.]